MVVKALAPARGFRWRKVLDEGVHATIEDLAKAKGVASSYLSRVLRLALLAPRSSRRSLMGGRRRRRLFPPRSLPSPRRKRGRSLWNLDPGPLRALSLPYAAGGTCPSAAIAPETGEAHMFDLVLIALGIGSFALLAGYAALCGRL